MKKVLTFAALILSTFLLSCSEDIKSGDDVWAEIFGQSSSSSYLSSSSGGSSSSSSNGTSSSSDGGTSSSSESQEIGQVGEDGRFIDPRDGKRYKFEPGPNGRIWMSENLNYSRNNTLGYCYGVEIDVVANPHQDASGCNNGYGRVYEYAVAIDRNSPQGLCPAGWHIPSTVEWNGLISGGVMSPGFYIKAGNYNTNINYDLGWKERGESGFYWTSSGNTYLAYLINHPPEVQTGASAVDYFSVRCIADGDIAFECNGVSYSPATQFCSGGSVYAKCGGKEYTPSDQFCSGTSVYEKCGGAVYDPAKQGCQGTNVRSKCGTYLYDPSTHFCSGNTPYAKCGGEEYNPANEECVGDVVVPIVSPSNSSAASSITYGGQTYRTVKIGTQTWFAENLNYNPGTGTSSCYNGQASYCETYGRLYDWSTAKTVCPTGWHLPNQAEWEALLSYVQSTSGCTNCDAAKLKATSGWNSNRNGTDEYGFSALPGGFVYPPSSFRDVGYSSSWWSSTENESNGDAYNLGIAYNEEYARWYSNIKTHLLSVRCVQN